MPTESVDCVVTSPPYWALRDYRVKGQIGLESSIEEYLARLMAVFAQIHRVLKPEGTCWVNFGDTYANKTKGGRKNKLRHNIFDSLNRASFPVFTPRLDIPPKSLCLIPSRFAIRMIEEQGWILRNEIIWHKPNAMPQSFKDRFTVDFEKLFFFTKSPKYSFTQQFEPLKNVERLQRRRLNPASPHKWKTGSPWLPFSSRSLEASRVKTLRAGGRNRRAVWSISTSQFKGKHFAVFPERLVETPIKAGCPSGGIVLDPFMGSGTTAAVAKRFGRRFIGIELSANYAKLGRERISQTENALHAG